MDENDYDSEPESETFLVSQLQVFLDSKSFISIENREKSGENILFLSATYPEDLDFAVIDVSIYIVTYEPSRRLVELAVGILANILLSEVHYKLVMRSRIYSKLLSIIFECTDTVVLSETFRFFANAFYYSYRDDVNFFGFSDDVIEELITNIGLNSLNRLLLSRFWRFIHCFLQIRKEILGLDIPENVLILVLKAYFECHQIIELLCDEKSDKYSGFASLSMVIEMLIAEVISEQHPRIFNISIILDLINYIFLLPFQSNTKYTYRYQNILSTEDYFHHFSTVLVIFQSFDIIMANNKEEWNHENIILKINDIMKSMISNTQLFLCNLFEIAEEAILLRYANEVFKIFQLFHLVISFFQKYPMTKGVTDHKLRYSYLLSFTSSALVSLLSLISDPSLRTWIEAQDPHCWDDVSHSLLTMSSILSSCETDVLSYNKYATRSKATQALISTCLTILPSGNRS